MADGTAMISVGQHQLAATVFGEGSPAVVIEPSFGGAAEDWEKIARALAEETTVVTYDRAPYGASSAARDARTPRDIAADLDGLLHELEVTGPVVLVGHSAGGIYIRAYAAAHLDRVAGMVLVESSHEGQRPVLDPLRSTKNRLDAALVIPAIIRESRQSRRGGDRRSIIREWLTFRRVTDAPPALPPGALGDRPLVVLTCAPGDPTVPDPMYQAWQRPAQGPGRALGQQQARPVGLHQPLPEPRRPRPGRHRDQRRRAVRQVRCPARGSRTSRLRR